MDLSKHEFAVGDIIEITVKRPEVYGLWCEYDGVSVLIRIPETSWIASFADCREFASIGDRFSAKVLAFNEPDEAITASIKAAYPDSNPWSGGWHLEEGMELSAKVHRYVESADRCGNKPGYLLQLRPGAYAVLCEADIDLAPGAECQVRIVKVQPHQRAVFLGRAR